MAYYLCLHQAVTFGSRNEHLGQIILITTSLPSSSQSHLVKGTVCSQRRNCLFPFGELPVPTNGISGNY